MEMLYIFLFRTGEPDFTPLRRIKRYKFRTVGPKGIESSCTNAFYTSDKCIVLGFIFLGVLESILCEFLRKPAFSTGRDIYCSMLSCHSFII